jgi:protein O-GlcNAc transferase
LQRRSLEILERLGFKAGLADTQRSLGDVYRARGDLAEADRLYRQALATHEALGHTYEQAIDTVDLAQVHSARGQLDEAEALYRRALLLFQEMKARPKIVSVQALLDGMSKQRAATGRSGATK